MEPIRREPISIRNIAEDTKANGEVFTSETYTPQSVVLKQVTFILDSYNGWKDACKAAAAYATGDTAAYDRYISNAIQWEKQHYQETKPRSSQGTKSDLLANKEYL